MDKGVENFKNASTLTSKGGGRKK